MAVLSDSEKETIRLIADTVLPQGDERKIPAEKIASRLDEFLTEADDPPVTLIKTAMDIMYSLVLFENVGVKVSEFRDQMNEALHSPIRAISDAARALHVLVTYIYYADPATDEQVGYVRFKNREHGINVATGRSEIETHQAIPGRGYDVCIVGSGVGGSLLAYRLAKAGKKVLVLEAGSYYSANDHKDDELMQLARLYSGTFFNVATGNSLPALQAKCVGGGGVVNNAVCFRMPDFVKKDWDNFGAYLNYGALHAAYDRVAHDLSIRPADQVFARNSENRLNRSGEFFLKGIKKLGIPYGPGDTNVTRPGYYPASVNIANCVGCGYCNIGCAYDRKVTSFTKYLLEAVATGNCDIVANAQVDHVSTDIQQLGRLKADGLRVKFANGRTRKVKAKKYILSAGAIASSGILLRSSWINLLGLPIGKRFSANVGTPVHARFDKRVDAYDGLQIAHYLYEPDETGHVGSVIETWFNPPATQSQVIPGFLDVHFKRMKKYAYYAAAAPLVGTEAVGEIKLNLLTRSTDLEFELPQSDLEKLKRSLRRIGEIFLEAGAEELFVMTRNEMVINSKAELSRIDREIDEPDDLAVLGTGHPQGGNAMSDVKLKDRHQGVVGTNFKVHNVKDLFVCDASVFPTSTKVNPQWTIMALADLCSQEVLADF